MKLKVLAISNSLSVFLAVVINYYSMFFGINDHKVGEISDKYENLFTPASYAFSIWGIIFIMLIAYCYYQIRQVFIKKNKPEYIYKTGWWFTLANLCNASWVFVWLFELTGLSVIIMFGILISLIMIVIRTNMEKWDAGIATILFVWWPICIYTGWISVAAIANISAYLSKADWNGFGISDISWTLIMILLATILNWIMVVSRNMREFAAMGIWALIAIYVRHFYKYHAIAYLALGCAIFLFVTVVFHGYKNRKTSPIAKAKENW